jgi:hypothetical protein
MRHNKLSLFVLTIIFLSSCSVQSTSITQTKKESTNTITVGTRTQTLTMQKRTLVPTVFFTEQPTSAPTLTSEETDSLLKGLLKTNGYCFLPCLFGEIKTGMSVEDYLNFLSQRGIEAFEGYGRVYDYYESRFVLSNGMILGLMSYIVDNKINGFVFDIQFHAAVFTREDWKAFAEKRLFATLGVPSKVELFSSFDVKNDIIAYPILYISYENLNISVEYVSSVRMKDGKIPLCPMSPEEEIVTFLLFTNTEYSTYFVEDPQRMDILEIMDMTPEEFYSYFMLGDENTCLEVPAKPFHDLWIGGGG